jgi:drug/metabolite transporter (DMT)-like permease
MTLTSSTTCSNDGRRQRRQRSRTTAARTTTTSTATTKWALFFVLAVSSRCSEAFSVQRPFSSSSSAFSKQQHTQSHPFSLLPNKSTSTSTRRTRLCVATSDTFRAASQKASVVTVSSTTATITADAIAAIAIAAADDANNYPQQQQHDDDDDDQVYRNGLWTVSLITVLFASNSPAVHAALTAVSVTPPVLLLNAAVACVALTSVKVGGPLLDNMIPEPSLLMNANEHDVNNEASLSLSDNNKSKNIMNWFQSMSPATHAGMELGLWKFLGTTANLYGLSQTSAGHGAFLIQLTTLLVPAAQGFMGVAIPTRIWSAIALALSGVFLFTQDTGGSGDAAAVGNVDSSSSTLDAASTVMSNMANHHSWQGDALCVVAAIFYATYDLRLFSWGQRVAPLQLITNKVTTQAALSVGLLALVTAFGSYSGDTHVGLEPILEFYRNASARDLGLVGAVTLWSGMIVAGIVPYLQVGGQQAVGPARAQILYASQPLWAALMSFVFLGETVGPMGTVGGTAFLGAMMLAATAEQPSNDDEK